MYRIGPLNLSARLALCCALCLPAASQGAILQVAEANITASSPLPISPLPPGVGAPCHGFGAGAGSASASAGCGYTNPTGVPASFEGTASAAVDDRGGLHAYASATANSESGIADRNVAAARAFAIDTVTISAPYGVPGIGLLRVNYAYHGHVSSSFDGTAAVILTNALCSEFTPCSTVDPGRFVWSSRTDTLSPSSLVASDFVVSSQNLRFQYDQPFDLETLLQAVASVSAPAEGGAYAGTATADFSATARITSIDVLDANGVPLTGGYTIFSANGVDYRSAVPLPAAVWGFGAACVIALRRRPARVR